MEMPKVRHGDAKGMPWICQRYAMDMPKVRHGYTIGTVCHGYTIVTP